MSRWLSTCDFGAREYLLSNGFLFARGHKAVIRVQHMKRDVFGDGLDIPEAFQREAGWAAKLVRANGTQEARLKYKLGNPRPSTNGSFSCRFDDAEAIAGAPGTIYPKLTVPRRISNAETPRTTRTPAKNGPRNGPAGKIFGKEKVFCLGR